MAGDTPKVEALLSVRFNYERESKNTIRYMEAEPDEQFDPNYPGAPVVGQLYMQKFAVRQMGLPEAEGGSFVLVIGRQAE